MLFKITSFRIDETKRLELVVRYAYCSERKRKGGLSLKKNVKKARNARSQEKKKKRRTIKVATITC